MNDEEYTKQKMKHNPLIRDLFNKLNTQVTVQTTNGKYRGLLKRIDVSDGRLEIKDEKGTHFLNWHYIISLDTKNMEDLK